MSKIRIPQTTEFIEVLVKSCNDMLKYFLKHDIKFTINYCYGYIEDLRYEYILDGQKTRFKANVFIYNTHYTFLNNEIKTKEYRSEYFDSIEDFLYCIFIQNKHCIKDLYEEAKKIYFETLKSGSLDIAKRKEEERKEQEEKRKIYDEFLCIPTDFLINN